MKLNRTVTNFAAALLTLLLTFTAYGQKQADNFQTDAQIQTGEQKSQLQGNLYRRRAFRVTITNLTPASPDMMSGQQFSPPTLVTHNASAPKLFQVGQPASFGLMRIAEEGNDGPLSTAVIVPNQGILFGEERIMPSVLPGQTRSEIINTDERFPLLSMVWMLVRTNDGFTGLDSINVYEFDNLESRTYDLVSYDAGTELNNELNPFLIARQGTERAPENGIVTTPHPNIRGDGDAPISWQFNPQLVGRVRITALPRSFSFIHQNDAWWQQSDAPQSKENR